MDQMETKSQFSPHAPEKGEDGGTKTERTKRPSRRTLMVFLVTLSLCFTSALICCFTNSSSQPQHALGFYSSSTATPDKLEQPTPEEANVFHRHRLIRQQQIQAGDKSVVTDTLVLAESSSTEVIASRTVLECFQVTQPVISSPALPARGEHGDEEVEGPDNEPPPCMVTLMEHKFGNSYGQPFVGDFRPPPCPFNRVTINFTTVSEGRQFDRLALMYLGDLEVWRSSTAEPTIPPGIRWEYHKDMTQFLSLWRKEQKVIFDLGNIVNDVYTGWFNTTLTATFFTVPGDDDHPYGASHPADLILPISKMLGSEGASSSFTIPQDTALVTIPAGGFPRNANRAVFSVSANGQADEEFWWSNVMESAKYTFFEALNGNLPSLSPWREVQILIDSQLAGVYWPFPVIFTGGVSPGLHRPIVGVDAFDLREHEIDISPWLSVLCNGQEHTFQLQVAGIDDTGAKVRITDQVASNWVVTGKIFIWLDEDENSITTGETPSVNIMDPVVKLEQHVTQDDASQNETLTYVLGVTRAIQVQGRVNTSTSDDTLTWYQNLGYQQDGFIWGKGHSQINDMKIIGDEHAQKENLDLIYKTAYLYPLYANSTYTVSPEGNLTIDAYVNQGLSWYVEGAAVHPTGIEAFLANPYTHQFGSDVSIPQKQYRGAFVSTQRDGTAWFFQTGDGKSSSGFGSTRQWFVFGAELDVRGDERLRLYSRDVVAVNGTVTSDHEMLGGHVSEKVITDQRQMGGEMDGYAPAGGRMKGRGASGL